MSFDAELHMSRAYSILIAIFVEELKVGVGYEMLLFKAELFGDPLDGYRLSLDFGIVAYRGLVKGDHGSAQPEDCPMLLIPEVASKSQEIEDAQNCFPLDQLALHFSPGLGAGKNPGRTLEGQIGLLPRNPQAQEGIGAPQTLVFEVHDVIVFEMPRSKEYGTEVAQAGFEQGGPFHAQLDLRLSVDQEMLLRRYLYHRRKRPKPA